MGNFGPEQMFLLLVIVFGVGYFSHQFLEELKIPLISFFLSTNRLQAIWTRTQFSNAAHRSRGAVLHQVDMLFDLVSFPQKSKHMVSLISVVLIYFQDYIFRLQAILKDHQSFL